MPAHLSLLSIASDLASLTVVPELGGRILELTDLARGRQWMWRNHTVALQPRPPGSVYDDTWVGGYEELFPNDAPTGAYPDHGELWSLPWETTEASGDRVTLEVQGPHTGARVSKQITLTGSVVRIDYRLEHRGPEPLPHLFKLHPAIAVTEHCTIDLPGGRVEPVDPEFGNILQSPYSAPWPGNGDLSRCRAPSSRTREFVYVHDAPEGWCGITDHAAGARLRLHYPTEVFPYCWLFMTYGGWRGHNVVVLEPCTNYPKDLAAAVRGGTAAVLNAHETRAIGVEISLGGS